VKTRYCNSSNLSNCKKSTY